MIVTKHDLLSGLYWSSHHTTAKKIQLAQWRVKTQIMVCGKFRTQTIPSNILNVIWKPAVPLFSCVLILYNSIQKLGYHFIITNKLSDILTLYCFFRFLGLNGGYNRETNLKFVHIGDILFTSSRVVILLIIIRPWNLFHLFTILE